LLKCIDVYDLSRLTQRAITVGKDIKDKSIILFIGDTGSGKTTAIKWLLGCKMGWTQFGKLKSIDIIE
jgi:ABC-type multidrug transport system ATPase subunit